MLNSNSYFNEMGKVVDEWTKEYSELNKRLQACNNKNGWHSRERRELSEEMEVLKNKNPFTRGESIAYAAWKNSVTDGALEFEVSDCICEDDIYGFLKTLRKARIESFVLTYADDNIMEIIYILVEEGCTITGPALMKYSGEDRKKMEVFGIRFLVNE